MYQNLGGSQDITESTVSPYFSLSLNEKILDMPLKINLGARIESTHVTSAGVSSLPTGQLTIVPTDHTAYSFTPSPPIPISTESNYRYLLPNLDLGLYVTDTLKLRFDASRTLTRAPLNLLTPDLNVPAGQRVGALTATGGNPTLLPFLSDNLDLGAEWYYAQNSYVSVDAFVKEVTNFVVGGTISQQINGVTLPGGAPAIFSVTSQVNGPSAEVRGIELAWQYTIGDTGFGFQTNATFVSTNKPYDPNNLSVSLASPSRAWPILTTSYRSSTSTAFRHGLRSIIKHQFLNSIRSNSERLAVRHRAHLRQCHHVCGLQHQLPDQQALQRLFHGSKPHRSGLQHAWPLHRANPGCGRHRKAIHARSSRQALGVLSERDS